MKESFDIIDQSKGKLIRKEIIGGSRLGDKSKKLTTRYEDTTEATDFAEYIGGINPVVAEDLKDDKDNFENRNLLLEEKYKKINPHLETKLVEMGLGLGDLNILGQEKTDEVIQEALAEIKRDEKESLLEIKREEEKAEKQDKAKPQKEAEPIKTYPLHTFQLMEKAAKFKALVDKIPWIKKYRPVSANGNPLLDNEIKKQAKNYVELKRNPQKWSDYNDTEINLMRDCNIWDYFYEEISQNQKNPTMQDGTPMIGKQIEELANEYKNFRQENPTEFAELKFENKEWLKEEIKWKLSKHNGRPQWVALHKSINLKFKDGTKQELKTEYVVTNIPAGLKPEDIKMSYFTIKKRIRKDDSTVIILVDLKPILARKKEAVKQ